MSKAKKSAICWMGVLCTLLIVGGFVMGDAQGDRMTATIPIWFWVLLSSPIWMGALIMGLAAIFFFVFFLLLLLGWI